MAFKYIIMIFLSVRHVQLGLLGGCSRMDRYIVLRGIYLIILFDTVPQWHLFGPLPIAAFAAATGMCGAQRQRERQRDIAPTWDVKMPLEFPIV